MTEIIRNSTLSQRIFFGVLVSIFIGVGIQYYFKLEKGKSAIYRWGHQILEMGQGDDVYERLNYPNPPIMAMVLTPFAELMRVNPKVGALAWFATKAMMAILCIVWVFRLIETPENPFPAWAKALTAALSIHPIIGDLQHGNVNIFILFLVIGTLVAFSRGRDVLAGIILSLAIACKVTPALFVFYFVWKGAWRTLIGTAIGLALFFFFVPALHLGWATNLRDLQSWIKVMIVPFVVNGVVTPEHSNQSLPGLVARMLTTAPSFSTYIGDIYTPLRYDNIADIGAASAKWLVKGFMAVFGLLIVWKCRAPIRESGRPAAEARRGWQLAAEYSLVVVGMLLFSERTWKHHCVTLLLPFAVLCYGISTPPIARGRAKFLWFTIFGAAVLMTLSSTGLYGETLKRTESEVGVTSFIVGPAGLVAATQSGIFTDSYAKLAQVYGAYTWAFLLLIAGLATQLWRENSMAGSTMSFPNRRPMRLAG